MSVWETERDSEIEVGQPSWGMVVCRKLPESQTMHVTKVVLWQINNSLRARTTQLSIENYEYFIELMLKPYVV